MAIPSLYRQLGVRYIEAALEKASADIRPGDTKPPVGVDRQANSLAGIVKQLRKKRIETPIKEENAPRVVGM